ncbi:polysaccharide biosynthesis C-terminal domain-containing protein [Clostridium thermosuccinogenes]|nr:polysaccharide biosynthesis C-terminal domain-containing protein [Pseudoclostridium thermosuccinogenes]
MNKYKKLLGNSIVFGIGNFGSKLISVILVPLYTHYLSTSEYGIVDIITTTINLLLPVISLSIYESVLRFAMDESESRFSVLTNALAVTILGSLIALIFYPLLRYFNVLDGLLNYMYIILILQAFQALLSQYARAIGKVKEYAINGIIQTSVISLSNILLLVIFREGIRGYLLSIVLSNIVSILFFIMATNMFVDSSYGKLNKKLIKNMLQYSIPLIPNSFMWWLVNTSNRYFIMYYEGVDINGLYAVANKIPTLLTLFTSVFSQAWQLSAIMEYDSEDSSKFYSNIFSCFQVLLSLCTSAILVMLKVIMRITVADEYYLSWKYVPFLLLGVVFSSFSGFLGTNYTAAKNTKGVFKTSLAGGIICVVLNFILVPVIGAVGAGISTAVGYLIMWIFRVIDTKRYIDMSIDNKNLVCSFVIILLQIIVLFLNFNTIIETLILASLLIMLLILDRRKLQLLLSTMRKK